MDLFVVTLGCLSFVVLVCLVTFLIESIELNLFEVVAFGTFLRMHRWIFNRG